MCVYLIALFLGNHQNRPGSRERSVASPLWRPSQCDSFNSGQSNSDHSHTANSGDNLEVSWTLYIFFLIGPFKWFRPTSSCSAPSIILFHFSVSVASSLHITVIHGFASIKLDAFALTFETTTSPFTRLILFGLHLY